MLKPQNPLQAPEANSQAQARARSKKVGEVVDHAATKAAAGKKSVPARDGLGKALRGVRFR